MKKFFETNEEAGNIADLQQLTSEEVEQVSGAGKATCSPSFTCAKTTCSETVVER